ncbi:MAG: hypothetical protein JNM39_00130 [Bdellovibrionaceae bacterium]|nr:hypothetical protein [Pseudobdellovibrionaceae bacterium]
MSTGMNGIFQTSLFSLSSGVSIMVSSDSQYRILSDVFPWVEAAEIVLENLVPRNSISWF